MWAENWARKYLSQSITLLIELSSCPHGIWNGDAQRSPTPLSLSHCWNSSIKKSLETKMRWLCCYFVVQCFNAPMLPWRQWFPLTNKIFPREFMAHYNTLMIAQTVRLSFNMYILRAMKSSILIAMQPTCYAQTVWNYFHFSLLNCVIL